jgi:large subunit ribosomal protein L13
MTATTKTFSPRPRDIERRWYVVDADGAVLGRLASEVAKILRGKHKPIFAPHADTGDHVIVVNARGTVLTGDKLEKKIYYRHSQYPGGLREINYARLLADRPALAVEKAVRGMLPKNRLGRAIIRKLAVYEGPEHPHQAQQPVALTLGDVPKWEGLPAPKPAPASTGGPEPGIAPAAKAAPSPRRRPLRDSRAGTSSASKRGTAKTSSSKRATARGRASTARGAASTARGGATAASTRARANASTTDVAKTSRRRSRKEKES